MPDIILLSRMLHQTPPLDLQEAVVIEEIDDLRRRLRFHVATPRRWLGSLRRHSFARAVQGSNTIEGYNATLDDVAAVAAGEEPLDADTQTRLALEGYRDAMTYVLQLAEDPHFRLDESLLRALHFMMLRHELPKNPGRWRPGVVYVRNEATGEIVYEGPDAALVPDLVAELVEAMAADEDAPVLVRAAMAHLNLAMIHPFSDGNGRMARCLQTLVLAREAIVEPVFASIEEYLGRNTPAYYAVLAEVGQGSWHPERDARPWLRFCLTAHLRQGRTLLRRAEESEQLWDACTREAEEAGLPERLVALLFNAALGFRERNATHRAAVADEITEGTATRDLRAATEAGLLVSHGEKRGRYYTASEHLLALAADIRARRPQVPEPDPFA